MEKKDIALHQLKSAARLYNSGEYISAITLAGAAEEILGQIAKRRTGTNEMEQYIEYNKSTIEFINKKTQENQEIKVQKIPDTSEIVKTINNTKNELKHNDSMENIWVEEDFENEAAILFVRAVKNYYRSFKESPKDTIIRNLFEHLTL